jgi:hypothetical protein
VIRELGLCLRKRGMPREETESGTIWGDIVSDVVSVCTQDQPNARSLTHIGDWRVVVHLAKLNYAAEARPDPAMAIRTRHAVAQHGQWPGHPSYPFAVRHVYS